jgi:hypothetical protein
LKPVTKYVTYFDWNYLPRALCLFSSIRENNDDSELYVLALDEEVEKYFDEKQMQGITVFNLKDLINTYPELLLARDNRAQVEFYFTCTPHAVKYVMDKFSNPNDLIIYLDADLYFFSKPQIAVDQMKDFSVGIIEHRYEPNLENQYIQFGRFNVGWVAFRNDLDGLGCLSWWQKACTEWCFDRVEDGKFADQGYLNDFESISNKTQILNSNKFNVAPWNLHEHDLNISLYSSAKTEESIVFFHFHGIKNICFNLYATSEPHYFYRLKNFQRRNIYKPYVSKLRYETHLVSKWKSKGIQSPQNIRGHFRPKSMFRLALSAFLKGNFVFAKISK